MDRLRISVYLCMVVALALFGSMHCDPVLIRDEDEARRYADYAESIASEVKSQAAQVAWNVTVDMSDENDQQSVGVCLGFKACNPISNRTWCTLLFKLGFQCK